MTDSPAFSFATTDFSALHIGTTGGGARGERPVSARSGVSALTGESEDFRNAQSTASNSVYGGGGVSVIKDKEVALILIEDSSLVCRAIIGDTNGTKGFCTRTCSECSTKGHKDNSEESSALKRADIQDGALMIVNRKDQALDNPFVMKTWLANEAAEIAKRESFTEDDWDNIEDVTPVLITVEEVEKGEADLKSPRGSRLEEIAVSLPDDTSSIDVGSVVKTTNLRPLLEFLVSNGAQDLPGELLAALNNIVEEWSSVQDNFETITKELTKQSGFQVLLRDAITETLTRAQTKLKMLDTKSGILLTRLGEDKNVEESGAQSAWDAINDLQLVLKGYKGSLDKFEQELGAATEKQEDQASNLKLEALIQDYQGKMQDIHEILGALTFRIEDVELTTPPEVGQHGRSAAQQLALEDLKRLVDQLYESHNLGPSNLSKIEELKDEVLRLREVVYENFQNLGNVAHADASQPRQGRSSSSFDNLRSRAKRSGSNAFSNGDVPGTADSRTPSSQKDTVSAGVRALGTDVDALKEQVKKLLQKQDNDGIVFGDWVFSHKRDLETFLERTGIDIGWVWDLFSALVMMYSGKHTGRSLADEYNSANRIGSTYLTTNMLAGLRSGRPTALFADDAHGRPKPHSEGMSAVKSFQHWTGTEDPYKNVIERDLMMFIEGIEGALPPRDAYESETQREGVRFCAELLSDIRKQWYALIAFFDKAYQELLAQAHFGPDKAWKLVGRFADAIFDEMMLVRRSARSLLDPNSLQSKATAVWAVLQTHKVLNQFMKLKFSGHTAIVREMSLFMLVERVPLSAHNELEVRVAKLEQGSSNSRQTNATQQNTNYATTSSVNTLKRKVEALEAELVAAKTASDDAIKIAKAVENAWGQWKRHHK